MHAFSELQGQKQEQYLHLTLGQIENSKVHQTLNNSDNSDQEVKNLTMEGDAALYDFRYDKSD